MTRILVLSNMYPPHHYGGYELSCRDVMGRLRNRGHEVSVLTTTMRVPGVADDLAEPGNGVRRELAFYWEDHKILNPPLRRRIQMERDNQRALRRAIETFSPEVVSAWNMGAMSLGLLTAVVDAGIPLVLNICDLWPLYGPRMDAWTRLYLGRPRLGAFIRRRTGLPTTLADLGPRAAFLFVSDWIRETIERSSMWRPRWSSVVYSGIDPQDFPPAPAEPRPWRWRLLSVGRIDERKGIHVAIEALSLLPDEATLDIYGEGDSTYLERLRRLARDQGVEHRLHFGVTPRTELKERYREADVLVFPTLWDEPFGLVPVEAMACGTPVVATGTGGSGEFLVDSENCLRVPPGDHAALARSIRRLATDASLRTRLLHGGKRTAEELTVDRLTDVLESWHVAATEGFSSNVPPRRRLTITGT